MSVATPVRKTPHVASKCPGCVVTPPPRTSPYAPLLSDLAPESGAATRHDTKPEAVALVENFRGPFVGRTAAPMAWSFVNPQLKRLRDRVRAEHRDILAEVDVHDLVHLEEHPVRGVGLHPGGGFHVIKKWLSYRYG